MSKGKVAILIGGPADGRRVALRPGMRYLNVAHRLRLTGSAHPSVDTCLETTADYTQYELFWAAGSVHVMCPSHMNREQAMRMLLEGYRCEVVH